MLKKLISIATISAVSLTSFNYASAKDGIYLGASTGASAGSHRDIGSATSLVAGYNVNSFSFELDLNNNLQSYDEEDYNNSTLATTLYVNALYNITIPSSKITPFIGAGVGLLWGTHGEDTNQILRFNGVKLAGEKGVDETETYRSIPFQLIAGIKTPISPRTNFKAEIVHQNVLDKRFNTSSNTDTFQLRVGLNFNL